jgi:hypothetical protein
MAPDGHILGVLGTPDRLQLIDWQNRVDDSNLVQQMCMQPRHPPALPLKLYFSSWNRAARGLTDCFGSPTCDEMVYRHFRLDFA